MAEQIGRDCRVRDPSDASDVLLGVDRADDPAGVASPQPTEIKRKSVREIDQGDIALIWPRAHSICRKMSASRPVPSSDCRISSPRRPGIPRYTQVSVDFYDYVGVGVWAFLSIPILWLGLTRVWDRIWADRDAGANLMVLGLAIICALALSHCL